MTTISEGTTEVRCARDTVAAVDAETLHHADDDGDGGDDTAVVVAVGVEVEVETVAVAALVVARA